MHASHAFDLQYHKKRLLLVKISLRIDFTIKETILKGFFTLHAGASAGTVLVAASAAAAVVAAVTGEQQEPDQRIARKAVAVFAVAEQKKQHEQPVQVGSTEIIEHSSILRS
jgi:hypothetical protein